MSLRSSTGTTATYDTAILGAGLGGCSLAEELSERGQKVLLIDRAGPGGGASGAPAMLLNPTAARRARLPDDAEPAYNAMLETLRKVQFRAEEPLYKRSGIVRPAIDEELYKYFTKAWQEQDWPEGWCRWIDDREVREHMPGITETHGGLMLECGMTVYTLDFLRAWFAQLAEDGVTTVPGAAAAFRRDGDHWFIALSDRAGVHLSEQPGGESHGTANTSRANLPSTALAESLVTATGSAATEDPLWKHVTLHPVKGQGAIFESDRELDWHTALAAKGYIIPMGSRRFLVGSTYEHRFDHTEPDQQGLETLLGKLDTLFPGMRDRVTLVRQGGGVRATTPDRMPLTETHPTEPNLYLFAGFGSKGLMQSRYHAAEMADVLTESRAGA